MGVKYLTGVKQGRRLQEVKMEENQVEQVEETPKEANVQEVEQEQSTSPAPAQNVEKTPAEINWEQTRTVLQMQKQRIEELEQRLNKPAPVEEEVDEFEDLEPTDYVTVEKAKKLADRQAKSAAREIVHEYMQKQNLSNDEQRMRSTHEDYDYVIEHYAAPLIRNDPALAHKIQTSKNPAETAYRLGKLADNYEAPEMAKENTKKVEKILKNSARPTSGNALGTPLKGQADSVLKMSPQQIWEQSQKYARGA